MKKLLRVFALFVTVAAMASLTSCSKDNAAKIIGKWQFEKVTIDATATDPDVQAEIDQYLDEYIKELNEELKGMVYEFKEDNTVTTSYEGFEYSQPYALDGDVLTIDDEKATIKTLNNSKLVLEYDYSDEEGKMIETIEFKRL